MKGEVFPEVGVGKAKLVFPEDIHSKQYIPNRSRQSSIFFICIVRKFVFLCENAFGMLKYGSIVVTIKFFYAFVRSINHLGIVLNGILMEQGYGIWGNDVVGI